MAFTIRRIVEDRSEGSLKAKRLGPPMRAAERDCAVR